MSDVPCEILLTILSRLPVVDLLRFRCVSKSWKCLIDSNEFSGHHLNHSLKNINSNLNIILKSCYLYSTDFDSLDETNRADFQQLAYPFRTELTGNVQVLGSCHGLLLLSKSPYHTTTILWNPSVRRFHEIPYESFECQDINYIYHGFGYDVVSDDYKLVRIVQAYGDADLEVRVYSLKSNSWKRIPNLPYRLYTWIPGELTNNALHWKVISDTANRAIAFDLGTEEFNLVPLPEFAVHNPYPMYVFVLGGYLSLKLRVNDCVYVWVMKEYGVLESWSFLFTLNLPADINTVRPIAYSKCNSKVLIGLDARVLMWYDLDKKSTVLPMVQIPIDKSYGEYYTCLQSFVLLNNGTCDADH